MCSIATLLNIYKESQSDSNNKKIKYLEFQCVRKIIKIIIKQKERKYIIIN